MKYSVTQDTCEQQLNDSVGQSAVLVGEWEKGWLDLISGKDLCSDKCLRGASDVTRGHQQ